MVLITNVITKNSLTNPQHNRWELPMETDLKAYLAEQGIERNEEPIVTPEPTETPSVEEPIVEQPKEGTQPNISDDLIKRVSQFEKEKGPNAQTEDLDTKFDYSELDKIQTPEEAKAWAEKAYKSFQRGTGQKFQEIAELRKEMQATLEQTKRWTPERVQALLQDPNFVSSAQQIAGVQTDNIDESMLSQAEQAELNRIKEQQQQLLNIYQQTQKEKEDFTLKDRYANYDASQVDEIFNGMMQGKVQATREHLWKVVDYEPAVQRAYELGLKDGQTNKTEITNSVSLEGRRAVSTAPIQREEGENSVEYFKRIARHNLDLLQGKQR